MISNFHSLVKLPAKFNARFVRQVIAKTNSILKQKSNWEVTVLVVGPKYIQKLNYQYRRKNKVTDVLSFSQKEGLSLKLPPRQAKYLGDIVLCFGQLKKQARIFQHSVEQEFALLLIHGYLHLLGYQDETEKEYRRMSQIQDLVLLKLYGKNKKII